MFFVPTKNQSSFAMKVALKLLRSLIGEVGPLRHKGRSPPQHSLLNFFTRFVSTLTNKELDVFSLRRLFRIFGDYEHALRKCDE